MTQSVSKYLGPLQRQMRARPCRAAAGAAPPPAGVGARSCAGQCGAQGDPNACLVSTYSQQERSRHMLGESLHLGALGRAGRVSSPPLRPPVRAPVGGVVCVRAAALGGGVALRADPAEGWGGGAPPPGGRAGCAGGRLPPPPPPRPGPPPRFFLAPAV